MSKEVTYIIIRDGFWWGIVGDIFMYGCLLGLYWFNYNQLGNNGVLNIIFTLIGITFVVNLFAKGSGRKQEFFSKDDAIKYLEQMK